MTLIQSPKVRPNRPPPGIFTPTVCSGMANERKDEAASNLAPRQQTSWRREHGERLRSTQLTSPQRSRHSMLHSATRLFPADCALAHSGGGDSWVPSSVALRPRIRVASVVSCPSSACRRLSLVVRPPLSTLCLRVEISQRDAASACSQPCASRRPHPASGPWPSDQTDREQRGRDNPSV